MKMKKDFRAVVFDLFGTLIRVAPKDSYGKMIARMAQALHVDETAFSRAWLATRPTRILGACATVKECLALTCKQYMNVRPSERELNEAQDLNESYVRAILLPKADALETVRALKARGLVLALLSDCYFVTAKLWKNLPLAPHFDTAVFSCREGRRKPDPRLYETVCARLGMAAKDCLYVGDGGGQELSGARKAGMTVVQVENEVEDPFPLESLDDVPHITALAVLLGITNR